jgi:enoyl-[acyl-carrier protein] reductase I
VTGEIHFVDCGYNIVAMPQPDSLRDRSNEPITKDAAQ